MQCLQQVVQIVHAVIFQFQLALALAGDDLHLTAQTVPQLLCGNGGIVHVGEGLGLVLGLRLCLVDLPDQFFRLPDGELTLRHLVGHSLHLSPVGETQDRPCVTGGDNIRFHVLGQLLWQSQQPHGVGDSGAGFSHLPGHFLLGQAEFLHQGLVALGLLHGIQILPLEIFDQTQLHGLAVVGLDDDDRDLVQTCLPGGPPAALAGDDLIIPGGLSPDIDGL